MHTRGSIRMPVPFPPRSAPLAAVATIPSPLGELTLVATAAGLRSLAWGTSRGEPTEGGRPAAGECAVAVPNPPDPAAAILRAAADQLTAYFAGERTEFDLPLDPGGTPFQKRAWTVLRTIPFGTTISYADQARHLGDARKARAVGGANGRNPLPIVVPCHRVIGSGGALVGFAAGTDSKAWLLDHERAVVERRQSRR